MNLTKINGLGARSIYSMIWCETLLCRFIFVNYRDLCVYTHTQLSLFIVLAQEILLYWNTMFSWGQYIEVTVWVVKAQGKGLSRRKVNLLE